MSSCSDFLQQPWFTKRRALNSARAGTTYAPGSYLAGSIAEITSCSRVRDEPYLATHVQALLLAGSQHLAALGAEELWHRGKVVSRRALGHLPRSLKQNQRVVSQVACVFISAKFAEAKSGTLRMIESRPPLCAQSHRSRSAQDRTSQISRRGARPAPAGRKCTRLHQCSFLNGTIYYVNRDISEIGHHFLLSTL